MVQWRAALRADGQLRLARLWRFAVAGLALFASALVFSGQTDLARGLAWLQAQVKTDGSLVTAGSTASDKQALCETATALQRLAGASPQLTTLLANLAPTDADATETLACWQQVRQKLGLPGAGPDTELRRVSGQGYAAYPGMTVSSAIDTGWALAAGLQNLSAGDRAALLSWVQGTQSADGSFATAGKADLLATAAVLRGLKDEVARSSVAAAIAGKASQWLIAQRQANGTWAGDVAVTALLFEAVHPYSGVNAGIASGVEAFLLAQQNPDGSWMGDPYVTAVALRALALTSVPPVNPILATTTVTVRGVVAQSSGQPVAGANVVATPASGPAQSVVTDANGAYYVQGVAPGSITLSASLSGYQTTTALVTLASGQTGVFSPTLYPVGATPPSGATIKGVVQAFGTNAALPGVTVQVAGPTTATGATDAAGAFTVNVSAGSYTVSYSLSGYDTQLQQVVLPDGSVGDAGTVLLRPARSTSSLRGTVSDFSGTPIAAATVSIDGVGSATTSSAGAYSFATLGGQQFSVTVSATGYATRSFTLSTSQPADLVQDFRLPGNSTPYLNLGALTVTPASAGVRSDVTATVVVSNPGSVEASDSASAIISAPDGSRVAGLVALDASGAPLPTITLPAGGSQTLYFRWNTGTFAPGTYQFTARLQVPNTPSRQDPDGVVVGSVQQRVDIAAGAGLSGSIAASPPVLRAGTNTPVKLSALVQNSGNVILPAQDYRLTIVDTKTGQAAHTDSVPGDSLPVAQLRELAFADWTPASGGNFRVELSASSTPGALLATTLYVGDSGSAAFTVDKSFVPAGTQTVRGTVKVSGQSVVNGTINDPLVPLVKQAISNAVATGDALAYNHYVNPSASQGQCYMCHVQTQAIVGGERSLRYTAPVNALRRAVLMSAITQNVGNENATSMTSTGLATDAGPVQYRDWPTGYWITNTTLALWAATQWHEPAAVNYSKVRMANYLMKAQSSDGSWYPDHNSAWWRTYSPMVGLNIGSLVALRDTLQAQPAPFGKKFVPFVVPGLPAGDKRVAQAPDGTLYIHLFEGALYALSPTGVLTPVSTGQNVRSVKVLADGRLLIASANGVFVRQADGTMQRLWATNAYDAQPMVDGNYLVTVWGGGALYKVTPAGAVTTLASDGRLAGSSLNTTIMPDGSIVVHSYYGQSVLRYSPTGQLLDLPIPIIPAGNPLLSNGYRGGYVLGMESGLYFYNKDWVAERWSSERIFSSTTLADGRLLVSYGGGLYYADDNPVNVADELARIDTSVNKAASWLKRGGTSDSNNLDLAFRLMGLGQAKKYYQGTPRATEFDALINAYAATLRGRQRADGGWVWDQCCYSTTDSMVTAMVGIALDTLNPSPDAPEVRKAVQLLLSRQHADGTWASEDGIASVPLIATTWVEIWLPVMLERLGGIDTDLNLTLPSSVALSNPSASPTSVVTAADGSTNYLWKLVGVTETSQQVGFDLTLKDMQVDEVRAVANQASLTFRNTFVAGTVTAPIDVPKVSVGTSLTLAVATDKPSYTDADHAIFTAPVGNPGSAPRDAFVRFTVLDAAGAVVETLPVGATVTVPAGGNITATSPWTVAGVLAGNYQLRADLLSPAGLSYGTATTAFAVTASASQSALARIGADRVTYTGAQTVALTSRVTDATANTVLENLEARTVVANAAGTPVFSHSEPIDQLAPTTSRQYAYALPASGLPAGSYQATLQLVGAGGTVLAQSTTSFTVLGADATGIGLTGKLQAAPATVFVGQGTQLTLQATNGSTIALSNVPVTVRVVDPVANVVVATFTGTVADWQPGQAQTFTFAWVGTGTHGQTLVAVASAQIAGKDVQLAQANLKILGILYTGTTAAVPAEVEAGSTASLQYTVTNPAPVVGRMLGKLTVTTPTGQQLASWPLDLNIASGATFAGNQLFVSGEQQQTLGLVLSQQLGTGSVVIATNTFKIVDPPVPVALATSVKGQARVLVLVSCPLGMGAKETAACEQQRSAAITSYLTGLGYAVKAVTTRDAFLAEMRCGTYNTYWVSGGATKLDAETIGEVHASVRRGEALWLDGVHDSRNRLLHDIAGVKQIGKLSVGNQVAALVEGGIYGAQSLPTQGRPDRFQPTTGAVQGTFTVTDRDCDDDDDDDGHGGKRTKTGAQTTVPAVVSNDYGNGKSLLFAFDLAGMITADVVRANGQLATFVSVSAANAASGSPTLTLGDVTTLAASVTNQGTRTVSFRAEATLPVGLASLTTTPAAQLASNTDGTTKATWTFTLAGGATQDLGWTVRALQAGTFNAPISVYSLPRTGSTAPPKLRASGTMTAEVKDAATLNANAKTGVDALQPTAMADKLWKFKAAAAVNTALAFYAHGNYEQAIAAWLAADDALGAVGSVETAPARLAIAMAVEAATDALCIQKCGSAVCQ